MALDGIVISNIVTELNDRLSGARIAKIAQPEADEILLTCKALPDRQGFCSPQVQAFRLSI